MNFETVYVKMNSFNYVIIMIIKATNYSFSLLYYDAIMNTGPLKQCLSYQSVVHGR